MTRFKVKQLLAPLISISLGCGQLWLSITPLVVCCAVESPASSPAHEAAPGEVAIFLGCGGPVGPGTVEQFTLDGKACGKVTLTATPYGLVHRGDSLVAVAPGVRIDDGKILVVHPDGTNEILKLKQNFPAPISIALDQKSGRLLIGDNEQNTVSCVLANAPGEVDLMFPAPLTAQQKHYPNMSIAATRDRRIIFSSDDPKGVWRLRLKPREVLGDPLINEEAGVAADPTTMRWVAMLASELKVFEGAKVQFSMTPPTGLKFWYYHVLAFAPDGTLFVVLNRGEDLEIQRVDLRDRKFTARFSLNVRDIKSMAIGRRYDWNQIEAAPR